MGDSLKQHRYRSSAIAKRFHGHAGFVQQRQMNIGQRCRFLELDMAISLVAACGAAGDDDGEVNVVVDVGVAHAAAI